MGLFVKRLRELLFPLPQLLLTVPFFLNGNKKMKLPLPTPFRQIYVRRLILKTIYGLGSALKDMTEGICYWVEAAIAIGGKAEPAIPTGGKGGKRRVPPGAGAI